MIYPDPALDPTMQSVPVTVAMTLWGEARGEPHAGIVAVACVLRNRVMDSRHRFGVGWKGVCLRPYQFSCWNPHDPNYEKMVEPLRHGNPEEWGVCSHVAREILADAIEDTTDGANHYFSRYIRPPAWAANMVKTAVIGSHIFLRDES